MYSSQSNNSCIYQRPFSFNFTRKGACSQFIYSCVFRGPAHHLYDLGIPDATEADIRKVAETSMHSYWDVEPFAVNPQMVFDGIMMANTLGKRRKGL